MRLFSIVSGIAVVFFLAGTAWAASPEGVIRDLAKANGVFVRSLAGTAPIVAEMNAPSKARALDLVEALQNHPRIGVVTARSGERTDAGYWFSLAIYPAKEPEKERDRRDEAYSAFMEIVRKKMDDPRSAEFAPRHEISVTQFPGQEYVIAGWMRQKNRFGAMVRGEYVAMLRLRGGMWRVVKLEFVD